MNAIMGNTTDISPFLLSRYAIPIKINDWEKNNKLAYTLSINASNRVVLSEANSHNPVNHPTGSIKENEANITLDNTRTKCSFLVKNLLANRTYIIKIIKAYETVSASPSFNHNSIIFEKKRLIKI